MKKHLFPRGMNRVFRGITKVVHLLLGHMSWQPPPWLRFLVARPLFALILVLACGGGAAGGWYGWQWYRHLPQPHTVAYSLQPPQLTDYRKTPAQVFPLQIRFAESTAPLDRIGKPVQTGVRLEPQQAGTWQWLDDRTLAFTPQSDWPINTKFSLSFAKKGFFATHVRLHQYEREFFSAPLFRHHKKCGTLSGSP